MTATYLPSNEIERRAYLLIGDYEKKYGRISPPVPVERIAENVLDLILEWSVIPESSGNIIFAGLDPMQKKVVFNERRKSEYDRSGGLYNTVLAHEIGHWILHVGPADLGLQGALSGMDMASPFVFRKSGPSTPVEWQAHTFMSYLVLPHKLLRNYMVTENLCDWATLYFLKDKFDITISALTMRLTKMGLISIDDDKTIYPSEALRKGQLRLD